ncbi:putative PIN and TRAM-domain containing protein precursor [Anaerohalosphaera lusitana]|uniref:Putative PIN and TRAM-domain containing protein n=1 Tax=Anaerohalosphaera lusitana TaxID=1936003 RepID=A0A1U9NPZ9_9BACT|nr:TRAM domain-containing protein [Anaerohalosphaera lusitana]AQT70013.1 putative PIN and TRAM-domain containing protein precursor [Anaerohalosphaera lusitana]
MLFLMFIRAIFVVVVIALLLLSLKASSEDGMSIGMLSWRVGYTLAVTFFVIAVEWLTPKKALKSVAAAFFGLLIGVLISWAMSPVLLMLNDLYFQMSEEPLKMSQWLMGACICYLSMSLVVRTKDDKRFIVPYVEFSRQTKGLRPLVLDTSVIIDGRIADISETKLFDAPLIVPRFVLNELQLIADSGDKMKRTRGRRGLDMLNKLQSSTIVEVDIDDTPPPGMDINSPVDQKLVAFTKNCDGRLVTNDFNLNKVAQLRGVDVININDLANAMKTVTLPGEMMTVKIIKPGDSPQQGVGYLDDGTMVVVENARDKINQTIEISVTSSLQTSAGRMIFGKFEKMAANKPRSNGRPEKKKYDQKQN